MYIVNVSFMVSAPVHGVWYDYIDNTFLPEIKSSLLVKNIIMSRVLGEQVQTHFTYSIQLYIEEISHYVKLKGGALGSMQVALPTLFKEDVTNFITVMKITK